MFRKSYLFWIRFCSGKDILGRKEKISFTDTLYKRYMFYSYNVTFESIDTKVQNKIRRNLNIEDAYGDFHRKIRSCCNGF